MVGLPGHKGSLTLLSIFTVVPLTLLEMMFEMSVPQQYFTSRTKFVMLHRHASGSRFDGTVNVHILSRPYPRLVDAGLVGEP